MDTQRSGTRFLLAFNAAMNRVVFRIAGFGDIIIMMVNNYTWTVCVWCVNIAIIVCLLLVCTDVCV